MGEKCVSVNHLTQLINDYSKIDHGLITSDVCQKDKQNFSSYEKISSDAVLSCLKKIPNSEATQAYLQIIKFVRLAFVEKSITITDRRYYAWCSVFIVRFWSTWLESTDSSELDERISYLFSTNFNTSIPKQNLFITIPALFSLELNAHSLTYLAVLVAEQTITEEALNISFLNSQMCESTFRIARSMSGAFSSVVNFSVNEFLQRVKKLAVLESIKCSSDSNKNNIIFPKHNKQSQQTCPASLTSTITTTITEKLLEETVFSAYIKASQILSGCRLSILDLNGKMISFEEVNRLAYNKLARSKCRTSKKKSVESNNNDDDEKEEEEEGNEHHQPDEQPSGNDIVDEYDELIPIDELDLDILPNVSSSTIHGMRIFDSIDSCQSESFFLVEMNGQSKYMHRQTANWYFSKTKPILSADRLNRVQNKK